MSNDKNDTNVEFDLDQIIDVTGAEMNRDNELGEDRLKGDDKSLRAGNFVLEGQTVASDEGFRNVSKKWYDRTISWEELQEKLEHNKGLNVDVNVPLENVELVQLELGQMAFKLGRDILGSDSSEGVWHLSDNVLQTLGNDLGLGAKLASVGRDLREWELIGELYEKRFAEWKKQGSGRVNFYRLRKGFDTGDLTGSCGSRGSVRAVLSQQYKVKDHRWFAGVLESLIPGGRVSHFEEDKFLGSGGDYCRFNILIPDTIRAEKDSEYGAMLNFSNSEIGRGGASGMPSLFRAICMNGCIWGAKSDKKFGWRSIHKGKQTLDELAAEMGTKLQGAIPLIVNGLDHLFTLRDNGEFVVEGSNGMQTLGLLAGKRYLNLTRSQKKGLYRAYMEEQETGDGRGLARSSAFEMVNSVTRYAGGKEVSLEERQGLEEIAGELLEAWYKDSGAFGRLVEDAKREVDIEKEIELIKMV